MIMTTAMLDNELSQYGNTRTKIGRMVAAGEIVPIKRGLYETNPHALGRYLAGSIYGPSYLSFEYALSEYGMIPEIAHVYTSATCGKRKTKRYKNAFGVYEYRDVPVSAFPLGVRIVHEEGYSYWMATAEKALCDLLYKCSPLGSRRSLETMLFEDLRIDDENLERLDTLEIERISAAYRCRNVSLLSAYVARGVPMILSSRNLGSFPQC